MGLRMIPVGILLMMSLYFYIVLQRVDRYFKLNLSKLTIIFILFLIVVPAFNFFGVWFLILIHFFQLGIVMEIMNLVLRWWDIRGWNILYNSFLPPLIITIVVLGYGYLNMRDIRRVEYNLYTEKELSNQEYKIGFLSDIHFENAINSERISHLIGRLNREKLDILLLGGDIVDESTSLEGVKDIFKALSEIKTQDGIYYVYGNHDMARYRKSPNYTLKDLIGAINRNKIKLLADESVKLESGVIIIGRKDKSMKGREESERLIQKVDLHRYIVLLDHQPVELEKNSKLGYDLQISGHTHNGQIFPFNIIIEKLKLAEFIYGHNNMDCFDVIVSSGASGWGYPLRTAGHSEYVIINILKRKKDI